VAGYGSKRLRKGCRDHVGKVPDPAGTGKNLQRPCADGTTGGARRGRDWRMSPYERRRRGNALPGDPRGRPSGSHTPGGQRGSGHSVATVMQAHPDTELETCGLGDCGEGAVQTSGRRGGLRTSAEVSCQEGRPAPRNGVQSRGQNRTRESRPSGIAGRLHGTWPMVKLGTNFATERAAVETLHLLARALEIYPDIRMSGSEGGGIGLTTGPPYPYFKLAYAPQYPRRSRSPWNSGCRSQTPLHYPLSSSIDRSWV
jgi:hypothetical protein